MTIVDIVYHCHHEYNEPHQLLQKHQPVLGFVQYIKDRLSYNIVRHLNYEGKEKKDNTCYAFFKRPNRPWQIPFRTHRYIKSLRPDVVLVHGFIFPLQVIALKLLLGTKTAIVLQHHAEYPVPSVRKLFQQFADRYIDGYMFTAAALAAPWVEQKIIKQEKIIAIQAASVIIEEKDKTFCKKKLGFSGNNNFLWVGRLNDNKDPLTVLRAFSSFAESNEAARLYMIYQSEELLEAVKKMITENESLAKKVILVGEITRKHIAEWYHAADFFISASRAEAAGYALLEALAAGCIPVVSKIPSYRKILNEGTAGYLFEPGNAQDLLKTLDKVSRIELPTTSAQTAAYFKEHLGFDKIANGMFEMFTRLYAVKR